MNEFPTVYPSLSYRDPKAAIEFLEAAFGAERHSVHEDENGVRHAELWLGSGMVILGPGDPAPGGAVYVVVAEPDEHFARARGAGAEIITEPRDTDHGSRDYGARDPEGYSWWFGTYQPYADTSPT